MNEQKDGGDAFPDARDQLAIQIMFKIMDGDLGLYRHERFLSTRAYRLADAMIAARAMCAPGMQEGV